MASSTQKVEDLQQLYASALALREYANDVAAAAERLLGAQAQPAKPSRRTMMSIQLTALQAQIVAGKRARRKK